MVSKGTLGISPYKMRGDLGIKNLNDFQSMQVCVYPPSNDDLTNQSR